ncbi:MAG: group 1 glycosyl transferase, partial [Haliea sp.]
MKTTNALRQGQNWVLHDYLQVNGGAERLVATLASGLPGYALGVSGVYPAFLASGDYPDLRPQVMGPAWLQALSRVPRALATFGWGCTRLQTADSVVYSGIYAPLAVSRQAGGRKVLYCHTPPRFAFDWMPAYLHRIPAVFRPLLETAILQYREAYLQAIRQMDTVVTNSRHVKSRLYLQTGIEAQVIYPPIDIARFQWQGQGDHYISLARLEPNKRVDRIVRAFLSM